MKFLFFVVVLLFGAMLVTVLWPVNPDVSHPHHYGGPTPVWSESDEFTPYGHWTCPKGYTADWDTFEPRQVWCKSEQEGNSEMEEYQRTMKP